MRIEKTELKYVVALQASGKPFIYPKINESQVAFIGRSNVGKSSLINTLTGISKLARVSNTPGKTQQINYFLINDKFFFVDLPGYGYAKESHELRNNWKKLIDGYFQSQENLRLCAVIIDIRHDISPLDLGMVDWLDHNRLDYIIILNKSDKLSNNELPQKVKSFDSFFLTKQYCKKVFPFSSVNKHGKNEVVKYLDDLVSKQY
jgi:GTP-binding protein